MSEHLSALYTCKVGGRIVRAFLEELFGPEAEHASCLSHGHHYTGSLHQHWLPWTAQGQQQAASKPALWCGWQDRLQPVQLHSVAGSPYSPLSHLAGSY